MPTSRTGLAGRARPPLDDLARLLLRALELELDADGVTFRGGRVLVAGARRSSPAAVGLIEEGLRRLEAPGDDRLRRYRALEALADGVDARAEHTVGHALRVARVAKRIAVAIDLDRGARRAVEVAARLHDVAAGFCGSEALFKPRLDEDERRAVRRHAELGGEIVLHAGLPAEVAAAVRGHHERWDGRGYPDGLRGTDIPVAARVIALAESYDALVSSRPWRPGLTPTDALAAIQRGAGSRFDPEAVAAFLGVRP